MLGGKALDNPGFSYLIIYIGHIGSLRCPVPSQTCPPPQNNLGLLVASIKLYKVLMKATLSNGLAAQQFFIRARAHKSTRFWQVIHLEDYSQPMCVCLYVRFKAHVPDRGRVSVRILLHISICYISITIFLNSPSVKIVGNKGKFSFKFYSIS